MEIKTHINFETVKNERKYVFSMPAGGTLQEAYDSCNEVLKKLVDLSKEATEKAKKEAEKEEDKEEVQDGEK